ncbi:resolvase [gut metagenome]|uniref:Resolvase n=1 Tax=gut metagenome TaxID=749906 RepID=J9D782_9ZZZZ
MEKKKVVQVNESGTWLRYYRVGIYCRVSSSSGAQLDSVTEQVSYLTQLVASRPDWRLSDTYIDIESGNHAYNRKQFNRMVRDCQQDKLDIIVTRTVSRFGRNTVDVLEKLRTLTKSGVEVRFVTDQLTTADPEHELLISIIAGLAQADNESRRENILWGIHRKLENGTSSIYSRPCYGYRKNDHGELVIAEDQARVVQLIFDLYLDGYSVLGIIRELEKRHIPSPSGKVKWPKRSIDTMLSNEKYCGNVLVVKSYTTPFPEVKRVTNKGEKQQYLAVGAHPVIIATEKFEAVQEEKKRRTNKVVTEDGTKRRSTRYSSKRKSDLQ